MIIEYINLKQLFQAVQTWHFSLVFTSSILIDTVHVTSHDHGYKRAKDMFFFILHILTYTNYEKLPLLLYFFLCECLWAKNSSFITSIY